MWEFIPEKEEESNLISFDSFVIFCKDVERFASENDKSSLVKTFWREHERGKGMKRKIAMLMFVGLLLVGVADAKEKKNITVETMPPSVVRTVPQAGDTEVDPMLKAITVTFSKDMLTEKMWAVCQVSKKNFPKGMKDIHYLKDKRTCVIPVILEPEQTYALWFNSGRFNSFRDANNNPAVPYLLVFQTGKSKITSSKSIQATGDTASGSSNGK